MLCDDEKAYAAYMNYLDAMEREGKAADPDKAMNAVLDQLEAADNARARMITCRSIAGGAQLDITYEVDGSRIMSLVDARTFQVMDPPK